MTAHHADPACANRPSGPPAPSSRRPGWAWLGVIGARLLVPLVSFLMTILVARFWGRSYLAEYVTVWSWLAISQYFSLFGLPDYIARQAGRHPQDAGSYFKHGLFFILSTAVVAMLLLALWALSSAYSREVKLCLLLASLSLPACACTALCQALCTALQKVPWITLSLLCESLIFLVGGLVVFLVGGSLPALIAVVVVARGVTGAGFLILLRRRLLPNLPALSRPFGRAILKGAAVFGVTAVASLVFLRLDVAVLSLFCSMDLMGPYTASARIVELCLVFPLTFYFVNLAPAAQFFRSPPGTRPVMIEQRAAEMFYVVLAITGGGMLFAETLLGMLFGPSFAAAGWILRLLLLGFLVMSAETVLLMSGQAAGFHHAIMWIALVRLATGLAFQWLFVARWGVTGAPFATLGAVLLSLMAIAFLVETRITHYDWPGILRKPLLAGLPAAAAVLALRPFCHVSVQIAAFGACYIVAVLLLEGRWRMLKRGSGLLQPAGCAMDDSRT